MIAAIFVRININQMSDYSYVFNAHPTFIENMYRQYQADPNAVEDGWRSFFAGFEFAGEGSAEGAAGAYLGGEADSDVLWQYGCGVRSHRE